MLLFRPSAVVICSHPMAWLLGVQRTYRNVASGSSTRTPLGNLTVTYIKACPTTMPCKLTPSSSIKQRQFLPLTAIRHGIHRMKCEQSRPIFVTNDTSVIVKQNQPLTDLVHTSCQNKTRGTDQLAYTRNCHRNPDPLSSRQTTPRCDRTSLISNGIRFLKQKTSNLTSARQHAFKASWRQGRHTDGCTRRIKCNMATMIQSHSITG